MIVLNYIFYYGSFIVIIFAIIRFHKTRHFHSGEGERLASAEFQRVKREEPDSSEAKISEAEFIVKHMSEKGPKYRNSIFLLIFGFFMLYLSNYIAKEITNQREKERRERIRKSGNGWPNPFRRNGSIWIPISNKSMLSFDMKTLWIKRP